MSNNDPANTPEARSVQAAMAAAGVTRQSELHPHFGKAIVFDGEAATIDYAIGDRFRVTIAATQRQPYGVISAIVDGPDGLTYTTPEE